MSAITQVTSRAIDHTFAHWVHTRSGSERVARAAFLASFAEGQGHACALLEASGIEPAFTSEDIAGLRDHAWVGDGAAFTPFVLDHRNRFYLWRNWRHEQCLADAILARSGQRTPAIAAADLASDVDALFAGGDRKHTQWQRAAVAAMPGARFFVLTGGPGTGKTTTVVRMLLVLLHHARACGLPVRPSIALAAPTGKAAQRLAQAIARGKHELAASLDADSPFVVLLQAIPHAEASTLHRLLGYRPHDNRFMHGAGDPLPADIVIVDEASMGDLAMMRQLVDSLRPDSVLILLGDPDQLASVDAGSVLADIVASAPRNRFPPALLERIAPVLADVPEATDANAHAALAGQIVTLEHVWRAGSGLQRGIRGLQRNDAAWLDAFIAGGADGELRLRACADSTALRACVDSWLDAHADLLARLTAHDVAAGVALASLREAQILCALREGPFGAQGLNALMTRRLAERHGFDALRAWHHGRPVIVTRNDYARGLFNGDVGIALDGIDGLRVWFEVSDRNGVAGLRSFPPRALPACETAWAITIHRSQGSEYADVAVVLPPDAASSVLSRELIYTAVSRARRRAELWALEPVLRAALARPVERHGGLRERLAQMS